MEKEAKENIDTIIKKDFQFIFKFDPKGLLPKGLGSSYFEPCKESLKEKGLNKSDTFVYVFWQNSEFCRYNGKSHILYVGIQKKERESYRIGDYLCNSPDETDRKTSNGLLYALENKGSVSLYVKKFDNVVDTEEEESILLDKCIEEYGELPPLNYSKGKKVKSQG